MFMAIESAPWSREELERFPEDGNRYEVLDGELFVTPQAGFDHQFVAARLVHALYAYCTAHKIGVVVGPGAVIWGRNELQPDIEVIPVSPPPPRQRTWQTLPFPILAIEILSPSGASRARDLDVKRVAYLKRGIATYWVLDLEERCVHCWSSAVEEETVVSGVLRWHPRPAVAPFEITIDQLLGPSAN
jgi:Uma2 family endonuclease